MCHMAFKIFKLVAVRQALTDPGLGDPCALQLLSPDEVLKHFGSISMFGVDEDEYRSMEIGNRFKRLSTRIGSQNKISFRHRWESEGL